MSSGLGAFVPGFLLGFSLILAIGAQNAFVLRQGLRGEHVFAVSLACAVSDAALISIGVFAFARIDAALPAVAPLLRWGGAAFLIFYGLRSFRAAMGPDAALVPAEGAAGPLGAALATCLALTWLNPHVYLDTVVLLGSVSAQFGEARWIFALGAVVASTTFFLSLGFGARALQPVFARPGAWRLLDASVGVLMWTLAVYLILP